MTIGSNDTYDINLVLCRELELMLPVHPEAKQSWHQLT